MSSFYLSRILSSSQGNVLSLISEQVRRAGERKRKHGPVRGELDSVSAAPDPTRLNLGLRLSGEVQAGLSASRCFSQGS